MTHLYFAYGSNLDPDQMLRRCPDARLVGVATLSGFRLAFTGRSKTWGGGVATVLLASSGLVQGLVWSISDRDLESLDRCEGFPYTYGRESFKVQLASGESGYALVYIKEDQTSAPPSAAYLEVIRQAYEQRGFDLAELERAARG